MAVPSKPILMTLLGLTLAGASPLLSAPAAARESAVDWLHHVSRLLRGSTDAVSRVDARIMAVDERSAKRTVAYAAFPGRGRRVVNATFQVAETARLGAVRVGDAVEVRAAPHAGVERVMGIRPQG